VHVHCGSQRYEMPLQLFAGISKSLSAFFAAHQVMISDHQLGREIYPLQTRWPCAGQYLS
jgi:hypothetical protein